MAMIEIEGRMVQVNTEDLIARMKSFRSSASVGKVEDVNKQRWLMAIAARWKYSFDDIQHVEVLEFRSGDRCFAIRRAHRNALIPFGLAKCVRRDREKEVLHFSANWDEHASCGSTGEIANAGYVNCPECMTISNSQQGLFG